MKAHKLDDLVSAAAKIAARKQLRGAVDAAIVAEMHLMGWKITHAWVKANKPKIEMMVRAQLELRIEKQIKSLAKATLQKLYVNIAE